jgi:hypothetical protein
MKMARRINEELNRNKVKEEKFPGITKGTKILCPASKK